MSELLNYILTHEQSFRKARLPSLYSDFRPQKHTNPDGYAANISAWRTALLNAARAGHIPSPNGGHDLLILQTSEGLLRALETSEWGRPLALGAVVNDAIESKHMIPLKDFLTATSSIYRRNWVLSPWQILHWGLRQIGLAGGTSAEDRLSVGDLVLVGNVEETANGILKRVSNLHASNTDRIYSKDLFRDEFGTILNGDGVFSESDLGVLLAFLAREKGAIAYDGETIKFFSPNSTSPIYISEQDRTVASLKTLIYSLTTQVAKLETRITQLSKTARNAVNSKNRASALSALRSKKLAESNLKQRSNTLAQLEEVYNKIEQASDQVEIVRVMEASAGVFKGLNKQVGGVERVEDVVEELRGEIGKVDEVGGIISESGGMVDEGEIDDELDAMETQQRKESEQREAEETGKRLAELETTERAKREDAAEDIEKRLSQLSVEEEKGRGREDPAREVSSPQQSGALPAG